MSEARTEVHEHDGDESDDHQVERQGRLLLRLQPGAWPAPPQEPDERPEERDAHRQEPSQGSDSEREPELPRNQVLQRIPELGRKQPLVRGRIQRLAVDSVLLPGERVPKGRVDPDVEPVRAGEGIGRDRSESDITCAEDRQRRCARAHVSLERTYTPRDQGGLTEQPEQDGDGDERTADLARHRQPQARADHDVSEPEAAARVSRATQRVCREQDGEQAEEDEPALHREEVARLDDGYRHRVERCCDQPSGNGEPPPQALEDHEREQEEEHD